MASGSVAISLILNSEFRCRGGRRRAIKFPQSIVDVRTPNLRKSAARNFVLINILRRINFMSHFILPELAGAVHRVAVKCRYHHLRIERHGKSVILNVM